VEHTATQKPTPITAKTVLLALQINFSKCQLALPFPTML